MAKNAKDRIQKYEFGGLVGRPTRGARRSVRDVSPSIRQRNIQGLEGRRPLPIPTPTITPEEGANIKAEINTMQEMQQMYEMQQMMQQQQQMQNEMEEQGGLSGGLTEMDQIFPQEPQLAKQMLGPTQPIPIGESSPSLAKQTLGPTQPIPIGGNKKGGKVTKKKRR